MPAMSCYSLSREPAEARRGEEVAARESRREAVDGGREVVAHVRGDSAFAPHSRAGRSASSLWEEVQRGFWGKGQRALILGALRAAAWVEGI
jgi:hypothetical protein